MPISTFLKDANNSVTREKLFFNKLYFDLKLAAAGRGYALQVFTPEVDRDGFDVMLDDADTDRRFQLKSFARSARTNSWSIRKRLLRPRLHCARTLGFEQSPAGVGLGGGVILIEIDDTDETCPVIYRFTDVFILTAFADGLIVSDNRSRRRQATAIVTALHTGVGNAEVRVPIGLFLKVRSPSCLLAAAGFHSSEDSYIWSGNLLNALGDGFRAEETPFSKEEGARTTTANAETAVEGLLSLIDDPELSMFHRPR